ncbi:MAG: TauD/TfdA family dioxygenase [Acidimicrobiales bacterium]|nr:TauD/TfdA family dioxygenase [Acidimicrobiales bacterium]
MTSETIIVREPLTGPAAWRGAELSRDDYVYELTDAELAGIDRLRTMLGPTVDSLGAIAPESTPTPEFADAIAVWLDRLENGVGFVVIRGLDLEGWTPREAGLVYYALGRQLGVPVKQNDRGHLLGHVRDTGKDIFTDPSARGYQVRIALPFHTDTSTDLLALLCYRTAKEGGDSALAPLQTIYNEVLHRRPDLIDTFYEPFRFDCRDDEHPDGGPFYTRVLASVGRDGRLSLRHNSGYARSAAHRFEDCPELTPRQDELLSLVDQLASDPEIHVRFRLTEGDIVLVNNYVVAHSRTAFEDHDDEDRKRHLMRLWLVLHEGRPLAPEFDNRAGLMTTADIHEDGLAPA